MAATMASVPALQANSQSAAWTCGHGADGLGDDGGGGLDRVGVRFRADPDRADLGRVDAGPRQGIAGRFDGHGDHVLVQPGDGFFLDRQAAFAAGPDAGDFLGRQAVARHIGAVTDDADRAGWFEQDVLDYRVDIVFRRV